METYGKILLIAMPIFLALVLFEKWFGWKRGNDTVRNFDMISSLSSGVTNVTKDVLGLSIIIISYPWLLEHLAVIHIKNSFIVYVIAFLALDFAGYWVHRIQHKNNFFWNAHIIHHSSEEFNLACALRQSISGIVKIFAIFLLPAAVLGVPEKVVAVIAPLHLFAQFWYHTQHINRMGFLEKIIVTPSHHRVHHAINPEYIDKNYGPIFIFWDKLFGSYQEEIPLVPAVYGITRPVRTWNPIKINFMHLWHLSRDAWYTRNWKDKLRIWTMPTGWRPEDVKDRINIHKIENVYQFEKYQTRATGAFAFWCWVQLIMTLLFLSYLFGNIAAIGSPGIFVYGLFIFLSVYAFTDLMDRNPFAVYWEVARALLGLAILYQFGDWFQLSSFLPGGGYVVACYLALSSVVAARFSVMHDREDTAIRASM